jgi:hypothetical protein
MRGADALYRRHGVLHSLDYNVSERSASFWQVRNTSRNESEH